MKNTLRTIFSAIVLAIALCVGAHAQNTTAQESRKAQLEKEILQLQDQLKSVSSRSRNALNQLTLVRKQLSNRRELLAESEKELALIRDSVRVVQNRANSLQKQLDTVTLYYNKLIRGAYRNRDARIWYMHILASDNIAQAGRRYSYLKTLSRELNSQGQQIKDLQSELELKLAELDKMKKKAEALRNSRQRDLDMLRQEESRSNDIVAQLNRNKSSYQRQLKTKQQQVEALNKEIERIIAQQMEKSSGKSDSKKPSKPIDYKLAAEFESNKGKLPWPADGPVVDKFGRQYHPVYKSLVMPFNNGVNISLSKDDVVFAVFDGEVKSIIVMPGYNKCVLVQHGSYFSFYCKLGQVSVKTGDKVKTGQTIGLVDTIDGQTELHFQVWKEKTPQNPELWLRSK